MLGENNTERISYIEKISYTERILLRDIKDKQVLKWYKIWLIDEQEDYNTVTFIDRYLTDKFKFYTMDSPHFNNFNAFYRDIDIRTYYHFSFSNYYPGCSIIPLPKIYTHDLYLFFQHEIWSGLLLILLLLRGYKNLDEESNKSLEQRKKELIILKETYY